MAKATHRIISQFFDSSYNRKNIFNIYLWKYYNLFQGAYRIKDKSTGEYIDENIQEFILRRFWSMGKIASFIVGGTKKTETDIELEEMRMEKSKELNVNDYPDGMPAFTDFAPRTYNIYDWPIVVNLIQSRGAKFIPNTPQNVNQDCVIGYCQKNKLPVRTIVEFYVARITDVEMTIRQQLNAHKVPYLIAVSPENEEKMKALFEKIQNDDDVLYLSANEVEALKVLATGTNFIIDKLYAQKQAYENELLTYLGIDNLGQLQKKEHFVVDEVNSNNELIKDSSDCFVVCVNDFFKRCEDYLGFSWELEAIARPEELVEQKQDMLNDEKGEENNVQ